MSVDRGICVDCARKRVVSSDEYYGGKNYDPTLWLPDPDAYDYNTYSLDINRHGEGEYFFVKHFDSYVDSDVERLAAYHASHRVLNQASIRSGGWELDGPLSQSVELTWKDIGPGHRAVEAKIRIRRKKR